MAMAPPSGRSPRPRRTAARQLARWVPLLLGLVGCADVLGLDGLRFERAEDSLVEPGTGGAGGEAPGLDPGTGGDPNSPYDVWGFPTAFPRDALIAAAVLPPTLEPRPERELSSSSFYVYEPNSGRFTSHRLTATQREETVSPWLPGFTSVLARPYDDELGVFGYDAGVNAVWSLVAPWDPWTGAGTNATPPAMSGHSGDATSDWTHVTVLRHADDWRVVYYDTHTGDFQLLLADPERMTESGREKVTGTWQSGWSTLVAYATEDGGHGLLKHDALTGRVEFDRFTEDGWALETVAAREWDSRWKLLLPFVADGKAQLVFYAPEGTVAMADLREDLVAPDSGASWPGRMTSLTLFEAGGALHALLYSSQTGAARRRQLHPLETDQVVVR